MPVSGFAVGAVALAAVAYVASWQGSARGDVPDAPAHAHGPAYAVAPAVEAPAADTRIDYRRLDARLSRLAESRDIVGFAVAVIEDGRMTFLKGYGATTATGGEPVTTRTVFRWASLSKTVAATEVVRLADRDRLSLDDPVAKFRTSLRLPHGAESVVTVRDLLSHRTGLVKNAYDDKLEENFEPKVIRQMYAGLSLLCAPGTCFAYQNIAFDTVGEIVRRVTGDDYAAAVRQSLFAPLAMSNASIGREGLVGARSWARGHTASRREVPIAEAYYRIPAAGGVNSSIFDLALWMRAQMGLAPRVLPERVLKELHEPEVSTARDRRATEYDRAMRDTSYALGFRNAFYEGHRLVGHRGAVRGYRSLISFDPALRTGVAVLWNSESVKPVGIPLEVLDMVYGNPRKDWLHLDTK